MSYRSTAQISNRSVWTNAGISAGVGAVSAFLQDQEVNRERSVYNADRDVTSEVWTVDENGNVKVKISMNVIDCVTGIWCYLKEIWRGIRGGPGAAARNVSTPLGIANAIIFKGRGLKGLRGAAKATKAIEKVSKSIKKIDDKYLKKLGIDAHQIKMDNLGKKAPIASYDLYTDTKTGEILIFKKGGLGDAIRTGEFIK